MAETAVFKPIQAHAAPAEARPVLTALLGIWAILILASLVQNLSGVDDDSRIWLLEVDYEASVYTWFSELLLAGAGALMFLIGRDRPSKGHWVNVQWLLLAGLAFFVSLDESVSLHEKLVEPLRAALNTSGAFYFAWIIPYGLACILGLLAAIPFLRSLPRRTMGLFVLAVATFLAGAIGCEMIGGALKENEYALAGQTAYHIAATVEEGLEGLGVLIVIYALVTYREGLRARR